MCDYNNFINYYDILPIELIEILISKLNENSINMFNITYFINSNYNIKWINIINTKYPYFYKFIEIINKSNINYELYIKLLEYTHIDNNYKIGLIDIIKYGEYDKLYNIDNLILLLPMDRFNNNNIFKLNEKVFYISCHEIMHNLYAHYELLYVNKTNQYNYEITDNNDMIIPSHLIDTSFLLIKFIMYNKYQNFYNKLIKLDEILDNNMYLDIFLFIIKLDLYYNDFDKLNIHYLNNININESYDFSDIILYFDEKSEVDCMYNYIITGIFDINNFEFIEFDGINNNIFYKGYIIFLIILILDNKIDSNMVLFKYKFIDTKFFDIIKKQNKK